MKNKETSAKERKRDGKNLRTLNDMSISFFEKKHKIRTRKMKLRPNEAEFCRKSFAGVLGTLLAPSLCGEVVGCDKIAAPSTVVSHESDMPTRSFVLVKPLSALVRASPT
jgi:hypothetical protein